MDTLEKAADVNIRDVIDRNFDVAAGRLGLPQGQRAMLKSSFREVKVEFPVRMDDGSVEVFAG